MSNLQALIEEGFKLSETGIGYLKAGVQIGAREQLNGTDFGLLMAGVRKAVEDVRREEFRARVSSGSMMNLKSSKGGRHLS